MLVLIGMAWSPARAEQPSASFDAAPEPFAGSWEGKLLLGAQELRLVLNLTRASDGKYSGTFDSPDQHATGIPFDTVTVDGRKVRALSRKTGISIQATLEEGSMTLRGAFAQGGGALPINFTRMATPPDYSKPQDPKPPFPYRAEEVTFANERDKVTLAGTLTLPEGTGPFAAVVLVTGSGAQDRDESILGHRPFLVLADHLTRKGVAVLRYDDRGFGKSTGNMETGTTEDFARDALAAVQYLATRTEVDPLRIGIVGHSEGGSIAPMVAVQSKDVAFVVMMAGLGVPGEDLLLAQSISVGGGEGFAESAIARNQELQRRLFAIIRSTPPGEALDKAKAVDAMKRMRDEALAEGDTAFAQSLGDQQIAMQANIIASPWLRFFVQYDPRPTLRAVTVPVLAINGSMDSQVGAKQNLAAIRAALTEGGNGDITIVELEGLNHLFQTCVTGAVSEYATIEETFAPVALETISAWILERTKR